MKIRKSNIIAYLFLGVSSAFYVFGFLFNKEDVVVYFIELTLIALTLFFLNKDSLVSANMLFTAYFCYTVALGPIFLLVDHIDYGYSYFRIILGGLLSFSWGNAIFGNMKFKSPVEDKGIFILNLSRKSALRILYLISLCASVAFLIENRNLILGGNLGSSRIDAISGNGALLYLSQLSILVVPMMYDLYFYGRQNAIKTISKYEVAVAATVASLTLLVSGFRAPVMTMAICLAMLIIQKNNIKNSKIIRIGMVMVVVVELLGIARNTMSGITNKSFIASLSTSLIVNDINLKYVFNTFPSKTPFQYGYTYLINLIMLLPGPDKDFTLWLKDEIGISFAGGGVTPTVMGEFYINFGTVGMYIGMFILGIVGVYVFRYFRHHSKTFLGVFYTWQFAHCASGGIANIMVTVILYTIVYWGLMMCPITSDRRLIRKYE